MLEANFYANEACAEYDEAVSPSSLIWDELVQDLCVCVCVWCLNSVGWGDGHQWDCGTSTSIHTHHHHHTQLKSDIIKFLNLPQYTLTCLYMFR